MFKTAKTAAYHGKRDPSYKAIGGFKVARMANGEYDYFPYGQPANVRGQKDASARYVSGYDWMPTINRWHENRYENQ